MIKWAYQFLIIYTTEMYSSKFKWTNENEINHVDFFFVEKGISDNLWQRNLCCENDYGFDFLNFSQS